MQREIKFRGMLRSGDWVYGGYVKTKSGANYILSGEWASFDIDGRVKNILKFNVVKYKTVGEYTGLKDKNGVEIYEGDILELNKVEYYEVIWEDKEACFALRCDDGLVIHGGLEDAHECFEVIGNIYENPEVLK